MKKWTFAWCFVFALSTHSVFSQTQPVNYDTLCAQVVENPESLAEYFLGRKELMKTLGRCSLIPISNKMTRFPVRAKLLICPNGKFAIAEVKAENPYYKSLEVETERILKLLGKFKPAKQSGKEVASYYWIQINYDPKKSVESPETLILLD